MYVQPAPQAAPQQVQMVAMQPQTIIIVQQQAPAVVVMAPPEEWRMPICKACTTDCGYCCASMWCPFCAIYKQRKRLLAFTGEPYSCCQRDSFYRPKTCCSDEYIPPPRALPTVWPPVPGSNPFLDEFQPELACEICCTGSGSALINRLLMMSKFNVINNCCDKCMMCGMVALNNTRADSNNDGQTSNGEAIAACIRAIIAASILGCLLTQQDQQLQYEEGKRLGKQPLMIVGAGQVVPLPAPPAQTMG